MSTRRGLVVLSGGQAERSGRYLVASEAMIISVLGMLQLAEPRGVSLNKLHKTLDRVREGRPRVDWYALRSTLEYLVNDGQLKTAEGRRMTMPWQKGKGRVVLFQLNDWEVWWDVLRKQLL